MPDRPPDSGRFSLSPPIICPNSTKSEFMESFQADSFGHEPPAKRVKYSPFPDNEAAMGFQRQELTEEDTAKYAANYSTIGDNSSMPGDQETTEDHDMEEVDAQNLADDISIEGEPVGSPREDHETLLARAQKLELIVQLYQQKDKKAAARLIQSQDDLEKAIKGFDDLSVQNTKLSQDVQFMNQRIAKVKESEQLQRELETATGENMFLKLQVEALKGEKEESVHRVINLEQEVGGLKSRLRGRSLASAESEQNICHTPEPMEGLKFGGKTRQSVGYINGPFSTRKYRNQHRALTLGREKPTFQEWHTDVKTMTRDERDEELSTLERKVRILRLLNGSRDVVTPAFR
ncbi:hypothetical protein HYALB_00012479 [Hymenoscyphus albidus]|uniref:Uncharacterized protein n=1 Tax=Hymenoscyphus albidus TaxID=595503 RepID=A0A9N9LUK9_9HELO|nr:hypothetical protein HYALB_00012479 [Hymenoscyphus albidus]